MRDWRQTSVNLAVMVLSHQAARHRGDRGSEMGLVLRMVAEAELVITAAMSEPDPAQAHDRTQSTLAAFFVGKPRPDLHPSNDDHQPAPSDPLIA